MRVQRLGITNETISRLARLLVPRSDSPQQLFVDRFPAAADSNAIDLYARALHAVGNRPGAGAGAVTIGQENCSPHAASLRSRVSVAKEFPNTRQRTARRFRSKQSLCCLHSGVYCRRTINLNAVDCCSDSSNCCERRKTSLRSRLNSSSCPCSSSISAAICSDWYIARNCAW